MTRSIVALAGCLGLGFALMGTGHNSEEASREEVRQFIRSAGATSPEVEADLLIRLAEVDRVLRRDERLEVLRHAFRIASGATWALKRVQVRGHTDTDAGMIDAANGLELDAVSLRCRALRQILSLSPREALGLIEEMRHLKVGTLPCTSPFRYDVTLYYTVANEVASAAFTAKERREGKATQFLAELMQRISSPVELPPAARIVMSATDHESRRGLLREFSGALVRTDSDPRAFYAIQQPLSNAVAEILRSVRAESESTQLLAQAYREFLVRNGKGVRCGDPGGAESMRDSVLFFNRRVLPAAGPDLGIIRDDELEPSKIEEAANWKEFWKGNDFAAAFDGYKRLRFGTKDEQESLGLLASEANRAGAILPESYRRSAEWESTFRQFLRNTMSIKPDRDAPDAHFHQKCLLYRYLLHIVPAGQLRHLLIAEFVSFLEQAPIRRDSPAEWLLHAKEGLLQHPEIRKGPLPSAVETSSDVIIRLYLTLERIRSVGANRSGGQADPRS